MRPLLRRSTLVLWLMLALLPLRGWAHATMVAAGLHEAAVVSADQALASDAQDARPCHAAASPEDADAAPSVDDTRLTASCHLCDLCHAPLAMTPEVRLPAFAQPGEAPAATGGTRVPHPAPERLERPPRPA